MIRHTPTHTCKIETGSSWSQLQQQRFTWTDQRRTNVHLYDQSRLKQNSIQALSCFTKTAMWPGWSAVRKEACSLTTHCLSFQMIVSVVRRPLETLERKLRREHWNYDNHVIPHHRRALSLQDDWNPFKGDCLGHSQWSIGIDRSCYGRSFFMFEVEVGGIEFEVFGGKLWCHSISWLSLPRN